MSVSDTKVKLEQIIRVAQDIQENLQDLEAVQNGKVHFRPASNGITMVGLLPDRPQRGKGGYQVQKLKANFQTEFYKYCVDIEQGRKTPEKQLQSFLIANAYQHQRKMQALQSRIASEEDTVLTFVTDEISIDTDDGKVVCDILAINRCKEGIAPVLMELKSERAMARLVEQLNNYHVIVTTYQTQFEQLFSALLGEDIRFSLPTEKWLVWTSLDITKPDRREKELLKQGIRIVGYMDTNGYDFQIGQRPAWR